MTCALPVGCYMNISQQLPQVHMHSALRPSKKICMAHCHHQLVRAHAARRKLGHIEVHDVRLYGIQQICSKQDLVSAYMQGDTHLLQLLKYRYSSPTSHAGTHQLPPSTVFVKLAPNCKAHSQQQQCQHRHSVLRSACGPSPSVHTSLC